MSAIATSTPRPSTLRSDALSRIGLRPVGRVAISWCMAGGVVAGGLLVVSITLAGRLSAGGISVVAATLFVMGAAAGLVHGGLLGYLARDPGVPRKDAFRQLGLAALWLIPALALSGLAAMWMSLTAAALSGSLPATATAGVAFGWMLGLALCAWAVAEGWMALSRAFRRWPDYRWGALILSGVFGVLVAIFHTVRPEIWFTDLRVTGFGAIFLALVATVWIGLPVAIVLLRVWHRLVAA